MNLREQASAFPKCMDSSCMDHKTSPLGFRAQRKRSVPSRKWWEMSIPIKEATGSGDYGVWSRVYLALKSVSPWDSNTPSLHTDKGGEDIALAILQGRWTIS